jgi:hypothetical protein
LESIPERVCPDSFLPAIETNQAGQVNDWNLRTIW